MPDTSLSALTASTPGTAGLLYTVQGGADRKLSMTAAGAQMIEAANAAAQQALLGITGGGAIALGGFTLTIPATGTAALLGTANVFTAAQTISGAGLTLSGNQSAAAWTTNGIRLVGVAGTLTDTSSSGTVATAYTNKLGGNTIAASSATTFTNYVSSYFSAPVAGTNVTLTQKWGLGTDYFRVDGNGAASQPAMLGCGTIYTGGTATTTKPQLLIEPAGTTSAGWSTNGTLFGGNAPSGFAGNLLDLQVNGSSKFRVGTDGSPNIGSDFITFGASTYFKKSGNDMRWYANASTFSAIAFGIVTGAGDSPDIGFARTSAGVGRISNGSTGRGTLDAAGYQVGGVAGVSGTITAASTVTVVNGIITVIA